MSKDWIIKKEISEVDKIIENDDIERERKEDEYDVKPCACQNVGQFKYAVFSIVLYCIVVVN